MGGAALSQSPHQAGSASLERSSKRRRSSAPAAAAPPAPPPPAVAFGALSAGARQHVLAVQGMLVMALAATKEGKLQKRIAMLTRDAEAVRTEQGKRAYTSAAAFLQTPAGRAFVGL